MVWYSPPEPPPFVRLAADPIRGRLLTELACGDRRVRELVELLGESQNLISYHLAKLRTASLVGARRSSFDGRDTYYHLNLARCARSLAATGTALHPSLDPDAGSAPEHHPRQTRRIVFLDTHNSVRSPMAEALLRHRAAQETAPVDVASAGSDPAPPHPAAVRVMRESYGLDIAGHQPQPLDAVTGQRFDMVISLCDRVREALPTFPGHHELIHWSIPDPALPVGGDSAGDEADHPAVRRVAAELDERIGLLLPTLDHVMPHREAS